MIPKEALNQHIAILGKTGSGKTATAKSAIVEPLLATGAQVCVIDPTSAWWGLRLKSDGKTATNERVIIIGGERGDVPLSPASGAAVARLVAEQGASVIVDTGGLTVGESTRWMIDFAGTLYTTIRNPLHLVIDEAHNFAPQARASDIDGGKMLHAVNRLMSGGRSRGIRGVLITQRPAKLHKDSLTCCDSLLAHRVIAPQDRSAIKEWVDGCGDAATGKQVMDSLASLARGECWVWYPEGSHLERTKMPMPRTFDSSKAPTGSEKRITLGSIDLSAVRASMDQAIKEAEANDPKALRSTIARLEAEAKRHKAVPTEVPAAIMQAAKEHAYANGALSVTNQLAPIRLQVADVALATTRLAEFVEGLRLKLQRVSADPMPGASPTPPRMVTNWDNVEQASSKGIKPKWDKADKNDLGPAFRENATAATKSPLPKAERSILTVLAQRGECSKRTLALTAGYAVNGGGFGNSLSKCRTSGFIEGHDTIRITRAGADALGPVDPLPTGRALLNHWCANAGGKAERMVLETLAAAGPLPKAELAERCGYAADGGGFGNALSKLRTLCLIEGKSTIDLAVELRGGR